MSRKSNITSEKIFNNIKFLLKTESQKEQIYIKVGGTEYDER
jgi:hypothetical protein